MPTANDVGAVSVGTTVNGKALSGNITLTAQDVGAIASSGRNQAKRGVAGFKPSDQINTNADLGRCRRSARKPNDKWKALTSNITITARTSEQVQSFGIASVEVCLNNGFRKPGASAGEHGQHGRAAKLTCKSMYADTSFNAVEKTGGARAYVSIARNSKSF